jgi:multidrug efflux pump subunit AcrA (membrane-fusion protein)
VAVGTVVEQAVTTAIEVVGTVEPHLATTLSAEIGGLTLRFDLQEGDAVQEGQTIVAQLKPTDLELALVEVQAELSRAKQVVQKLKRGLRSEEIDEKRAEVQERKTWMEKYAKDLERSQSLRNRAIASVSDYDQVESTYLAAQAQYERAKQSLRVAELGSRREDIAAQEAEVKRLQARVQRLQGDVQKTTIYAPVSGFITQRYTEIGQWIERGERIADLIDLRVVFVRVPIHEKDIGRVRVDDPATVTLDAFPGRTFEGRVKHLVPQADPASRTFPVKIEVTNTSDNALKAGMSARVQLRSGDARPTVLIPKDAVARSAGKQVVFVVRNDKAHLTPIKSGRSYNSSIEVLEGALKPGDRVVVTGNETLRDQAAVVIKDNVSH